MLTACAIGCFAFGLQYGFFFLANFNGYKKYILGLWKYENNVKKIIKIFVYIICAGFPAITFFLISKYLAKSALTKYSFNCLGALFGGLGLSYFAPILTSKCKIMKLLPGHAEDYVE